MKPIDGIIGRESLESLNGICKMVMGKLNQNKKDCTLESAILEEKKCFWQMTGKNMS